jgi:hypothetical protein
VGKNTPRNLGSCRLIDWMQNLGSFHPIGLVARRIGLCVPAANAKPSRLVSVAPRALAFV